MAFDVSASISILQNVVLDDVKTNTGHNPRHDTSPIRTFFVESVLSYAVNDRRQHQQHCRHRQGSIRPFLHAPEYEVMNRLIIPQEIHASQDARASPTHEKTVRLIVWRPIPPTITQGDSTDVL